MLLFVILLGGHHRKFMFFMSYVMPFACLLGGTVGFMLLHSFLRLRLQRFLGMGLALGLGIYGLRGSQWNWHPAFAASPKTALLLIGFPIVGAAAYWAMLNRLAPELGEE